MTTTETNGTAVRTVACPKGCGRDGLTMRQLPGHMRWCKGTTTAKAPPKKKKAPPKKVSTESLPIDVGHSKGQALAVALRYCPCCGLDLSAMVTAFRIALGLKGGAA